MKKSLNNINNQEIKAEEKKKKKNFLNIFFYKDLQKN
jgi:hypothetical protein